MPREFNSSKLSDDLKQQMKNSTDKYAKYLESVLERKPTFEDLINDRLSKTSLDNVDSTFNSYKYMWELSGRDISNAEKVYEKYILNELESSYNSNEYLMSQTDSIVSNISENPFYQLENNAMFNNDLEVDIEHCNKCGKNYEVGLKDGCPYCRKEETSFKKTEGFSFNTAFYIGIGLYIIYLLSHIQENVLILLLAIASFGLLYFLDNNK